LDIERYWMDKKDPCIRTVVRNACGYHLKSEPEMAAIAAEVIRSWDESGATLPPCYEPNLGTFTMALPWGGKVVAAQDSYSHIEPASRDIDEILDIHPAENPHADMAVRVYKAICEKTGRTDIRFMTPDHQGTLSTAAMVMDQTDLFVAMHTMPDKVHQLLDRICESNIAFVQRLINETGRVDGNFWPQIWVPHSIGIVVVEDMMPLMSADLYKEFGIPYLERYSDAFGGVFFHCCGEWRHHMSNLAESDVNLLGFEYHHPHTTFDDIQDHFDDVVVVPFINWASDHAGYEDVESFRNDLIAKRRDGIRLWFADCEE